MLDKYSEQPKNHRDHRYVGLTTDLTKQCLDTFKCWFFVWVCLIYYVLFTSACLTISEGLSYTRSCSSGYYLLITNARWYCSTSSTNSLRVTSIVNSNCNYNNACTLYATTFWLGSDPCPGVTKYFEWSDECHSKFVSCFCFI